jgi:O-antigen/teichoic acid export membrane protein
MWALTSRVLAAGGFFGANVLLGRSLGVDGFGVATVAMTVAVFASFAVSGGTNRSLLRELTGAIAVDDHPRAARALHDVIGILRWSVPLGAGLAFVITVALSWSSAEPIPLGLAAALLATLLGTTLVIADALRALGELRMSSLLAGRSGGAAVQLTLMAGLIVCVWLGWSTPLTAVIVYSLAVAVALVPAAILVMRFRQRVLGDVPPVRGASAVHLRNSLPFLFNQMALLINGQVDLWVASALLSADQLGLYAAGLRPVTIVSLPLQAAEIVMTPRIASLHAIGDRRRMEREARRSATYVTAGSLALFLPLLVAPELALTLMFGPEFAGGAVVVRILAIGQLCNAVTGQCNTVLAMTGHERLVLGMSLLGVVGSIVASAAGALLGGLTGLALGAMITTSGLWLIMWILARRVTGVWSHATVAPLGKLWALASARRST